MMPINQRCKEQGYCTCKTYNCLIYGIRELQEENDILLEMLDTNKLLAENERHRQKRLKQHRVIKELKAQLENYQKNWHCACGGWSEPEMKHCQFCGGLRKDTWYATKIKELEAQLEQARGLPRFNVEPPYPSGGNLRIIAAKDGQWVRADELAAIGEDES
jgi:hypothetical protein